jgi:hypothetical protein
MRQVLTPVIAATVMAGVIAIGFGFGSHPGIGSTPQPVEPKPGTDRGHRLKMIGGNLEISTPAAPKEDKQNTVAPPPNQESNSEAAVFPSAPAASPTPVASPANNQEQQRRSTSTDICVQHKGWKVETNNGKSWHCEYPPGMYR